jgi:hypothetical protein
MHLHNIMAQCIMKTVRRVAVQIFLQGNISIAELTYSVTPKCSLLECKCILNPMTAAGN